MINDSFQHGKEIIQKIKAANEQAYFVGGCVRDLLLKRPIKDIDIATSATPEKVMKIFPTVIPVGIEHGTVIVRYKNESYEVTTFRTEGSYSNKRHPDEVQFIRTIDEDLKRRDFTINALAMDENGTIFDLFHGQEDLKAEIIRTVRDPYERFQEDALRMVRAIRFTSQLGFTIEPKTLQSITKLRKNIESISVERITNEFSKLFSGDFVQQAIFYLNETKIVEHLPILKDDHRCIEVLKRIDRPLHSFGEVIAYFHDQVPEISIRTWVKNWKCSREIERKATILHKTIQMYREKGLNDWLIYQLPKEEQASFIRLLHILFPGDFISLDHLVKKKETLPIQSRTDLALNGKDLVQMFPELKKGPWIRKLLETLERKVIFGEIRNEQKKLKEWILCNPPKINSFKH